MIFSLHYFRLFQDLVTTKSTVNFKKRQQHQKMTIQLLLLHLVPSPGLAQETIFFNNHQTCYTINNFVFLPSCTELPIIPHCFFCHPGIVRKLCNRLQNMSSLYMLTPSPASHLERQTTEIDFYLYLGV